MPRSISNPALYLFTALMLIFGTHAIAQSGLEANDRLLESYIDGLIAPTMEEHHIPGLAIAIVEDGAVSVLKGYGRADIAGNRPVDPQRDLFRIGSVTKTFTFTALMQLVERGQVDPDVDVNRYLTQFQIPEAFGAPVRIRDLMAHRTGFEEVHRGLWAKSPGDYGTLENWLANNIPARVFPPGTISSYSNYGAGLAGLVVQNVSGEQYSDYLERHIFQPLNMRSTTARQGWTAGNEDTMSAALANRMVQTYIWRGGYLEPYRYRRVIGAPAGSISSTAADMTNYMRAHLGEGAFAGGTILKPATARAMRRRNYDDRQSGDYAHGFRTGRIGGFDTFEHGGATFTSYSSMLMIPELEIGIFIATNGGDYPFAPQDAARQIARHVVGNRARAEPPSISLSASDLARYSGSYVSTRREYTGVLKILSAFTGASSVSVTPHNTLLISGSGGPAEYEPVSTTTFRNRNTGELITFSLDKNGDENGAAKWFTNEYGNSTNMRMRPDTNAQLLLLAFGLAAVSAVIALVNAWRRRGKLRPAKGLARHLPLANTLTAAMVLVVVGSCAAMLVQLAGLGDDVLYVWPIASAKWLLTSILVLIAMTALLAIGTVAALAANDLTIWRKIWYVAFVGVLIFLVVQLSNWNLVGYKYW